MIDSFVGVIWLPFLSLSDCIKIIILIISRINTKRSRIKFQTDNHMSYLLEYYCSKALNHTALSSSKAGRYLLYLYFSYDVIELI